MIMLRAPHTAGVRMRALPLHAPYPGLILDLPHAHREAIGNREGSVMGTLGPLLIHVSARATAERHAAALTVARKAGVRVLPSAQGRGALHGGPSRRAHAHANNNDPATDATINCRCNTCSCTPLAQRCSAPTDQGPC